MCWKLMFYGLLRDSVTAPCSTAKSVITGNVRLCAGDLFVCTAGRMWSWNCGARLKQCLICQHWLFCTYCHGAQVAEMRPSHVACGTTRLFPVGVYEKCHVWVYCVGDQHIGTQQIALAVGAVTAKLLRCVDCKSSARHLHVTGGWLQRYSLQNHQVTFWTLYLFCLLPFIQ